MAAKKINMLVMAGSWLFIVGIILAIIAGFWPLSTVWTAILIVIGLLVGLLNVTSGEAKTFLLTAAVLVIVANFGGPILANVWIGLQRMLNAIIVLTIPATIVVAVKQLFALAKDE